jgi:UDP-N-acetylglucosamine 2-epimerase
MTARRIAMVIGTRPEAIKMAPVYLGLAKDPRTEVLLVATAQHRAMLDQVLSVFGIKPDVDLDLMQQDQTLAELSSRVISGVHAALAQLRPDAVLVHGDTSTCLFSALAAFYQRVPVGHVEAGLRTYNFDAPWPEEMNRRLTDPICQWCFAPTARARENLLAEAVPDENIFVTGNTIVDALLIARDMARRRPLAVPGLSAQALDGKRLVLITGHRRESFGQPFQEFCFALRDVVRRHEDVVLVYPVHLNPNVQQPVHHILGQQDRVFLVPPVDYLSFVGLMDRSYLIITDSGGIQEEAPSLAKPVLVTRETTERPEAVEAGLARLVGTSRERIVEEVGRLLTDDGLYARMCRGHNPYGDGRAAERIIDALCQGPGPQNAGERPSAANARGDESR